MSEIRRILVINPNATILGIKKILANKKTPLNLDKDYINRLVNIIRKERARRLDSYTVNVVLAKFQDEVDELKKRLWAIISSPSSSYQEKIAAIRELRNSSKDLFDKMFDAGVFERKLGKLNLKGVLTADERDMIKKVIDLDYGGNRPTATNGENRKE